jgi:hypothetical protein
VEFRRQAATVGPRPNVSVTAGGRGDISVTHASPIARGAPACDECATQTEWHSWRQRLRIGTLNQVRVEDEAKAAKASHLPGRIQMAPTKPARLSFCANVPIGG